MTQWRPDLTLDHLTGALDAEILSPPEPAVRALAEHTWRDAKRLRHILPRARPGR
ncbi:MULTISPECIES: hypothetical protein [Methylobacterium]|uniref:hypothetical protein n=1 Tax=Methylobacterium TaxID=407 RepID=UPI0013ED3F27|nr:hypothetical protein [Methylobacterium sp. DB0501]NGM34532.1 hypothetical protein [Methylobacterium sp. DB0501]